MSYNEYELVKMHEGTVCSSCQADLSGKVGCRMYYRDYCMICSKPLREEAIEKKFRDLNNNRRSRVQTENDKYQNREKEYDKYINRQLNKEDKRGNRGFHGSGYGRKRESNKRITIELPTYKKMLYYTRASRGEISGFGRVDVKGNEVRIINAIIFKQECTSGGTELNQERLSQFVVSLIRMGFKPNEWRLWWHSHNDFGVFWSGTDDGTIEELSKKSTLYSICINKTGSVTGREDIDGEEAEIPVDIRHEEDASIKKECEKEVKELVTYTTYRERNNYNTGGYINNDAWYSNWEWAKFSKKEKKRMRKRYTYSVEDSRWNRDT